MSSLIVLDPALSLNDFNHHHSLYIEIATAAQEMRIPYTVLASAWNQPPDCEGVVQFFETETYYFFEDIHDYRNREHHIRGAAEPC